MLKLSKLGVWAFYGRQTSRAGRVIYRSVSAAVRGEINKDRRLVMGSRRCDTAET